MKGTIVKLYETAINKNCNFHKSETIKKKYSPKTPLVVAAPSGSQCTH